MLIAMQTYGMYSTKLIVPFFKQFHPDLVIGTLEPYPHLWPLPSYRLWLSWRW